MLWLGLRSHFLINDDLTSISNFMPNLKAVNQSQSFLRCIHCPSISYELILWIYNGFHSRPNSVWWQPLQRGDTNVHANRHTVLGEAPLKVQLLWRSWHLACRPLESPRPKTMAKREYYINGALYRFWIYDLLSSNQLSWKSEIWGIKRRRNYKVMCHVKALVARSHKGHQTI